MPFYEHECEKCGLIEEKLLSIDHEPQRHCGESMSRVFSAPIRYEGSAFYTSEYGRQKALESHKQIVFDQIKGKFTLPRNPYGSTVDGIDH
jgi:putative FmdB family regulatory protein